MPFTDSTRKQFSQVVPTDPTTPTIPAHLQALVDEIEEKVVLVASDWSYANTFIAPYVDGMVLFVDDIGSLFLRVSGEWQKMHPTSFTGTGNPAAGLGDDGDLYFKTTT
jgi:hypothetical protein